MSIIENFRTEMNNNTEWQEEIVGLSNNASIVQFASDKGYAFNEDELDEYINNNKDAELSLFEMQLVTGGTHSGSNSM